MDSQVLKAKKDKLAGIITVVVVVVVVDVLILLVVVIIIIIIIILRLSCSYNVLCFRGYRLDHSDTVVPTMFV